MTKVLASSSRPKVVRIQNTCETLVQVKLTLFHLIVDANTFRGVLDNIKKLRPKSVFSQRTEDSSASQYFQFYGYLSQQQNMMQDYVRTSTYQKAILGNLVDFNVRLTYI